MAQAAGVAVACGPGAGAPEAPGEERQDVEGDDPEDEEYLVAVAEGAEGAIHRAQAVDEPGAKQEEGDDAEAVGAEAEDEERDAGGDPEGDDGDPGESPEDAEHGFYQAAGATVVATEGLGIGNVADGADDVEVGGVEGGEGDGGEGEDDAEGDGDEEALRVDVEGDAEAEFAGDEVEDADEGVCDGGAEEGADGGGHDVVAAAFREEHLGEVEPLHADGAGQCPSPCGARRPA